MSLIGLAFKFRFRGKTQRLYTLYECFHARPDEALHPVQVSRLTGFGVAEVSSRLDNTPELFVRLPRRPDGLTRYRLTSTTSAKSPEQVEAMLQSGARSESITFYAVVLVLLCLLAMAVLISLPWLGELFVLNEARG